MSAETGHTPGPWELARACARNAEGNLEITEYFVRVPGGDVALAAEISDAGGGMSLDNARLIAAAPDLLDALRMTERTITQMAPWSPDVAEGVGAILGIARAAIQKATTP